MKLKPRHQELVDTEDLQDESLSTTNIELPYLLEDIDPVSLEQIFSYFKQLKFTTSTPDLDAQISLKSKEILERINFLINKSPKFKKDLVRLFTKLEDGTLVHIEIRQFALKYLDKISIVSLNDAWRQLTYVPPGMDPMIGMLAFPLKLKFFLVALIISLVYATGKSWVNGDKGLGIEILADGVTEAQYSLNKLAVFYVAKVLYYNLNQQKAKNNVHEEA